MIERVIVEVLRIKEGENGKRLTETFGVTSDYPSKDSLVVYYDEKTGKFTYKVVEENYEKIVHY